MSETMGAVTTAPRPWRDDLLTALASIGGGGYLDDIYDAIEKIRAPLTKEWKSTVRCKLQQFSSDSQWWRKLTRRKRPDLFINPRAGYWELRELQELRRAEAAIVQRLQRQVADQDQTIQGLQQHVATQDQTIASLRQQLRRLEERQRALRVLFLTAPPSRPRRR